MVAAAIIASNRAPGVELAKVLATPDKTQTPSILLALQAKALRPFAAAILMIRFHCPGGDCWWAAAGRWTKADGAVAGRQSGSGRRRRFQPGF